MGRAGGGGEAVRGSEAGLATVLWGTHPACSLLSISQCCRITTSVEVMCVCGAAFSLLLFLALRKSFPFVSLLSLSLSLLFLMDIALPQQMHTHIYYKHGCIKHTCTFFFPAFVPLLPVTKSTLLFPLLLQPSLFPSLSVEGGKPSLQRHVCLFLGSCTGEANNRKQRQRLLRLLRGGKGPAVSAALFLGFL